MGLMRLMSRATGTLACLAAGLSGVGSSALPRDGGSPAVAAHGRAFSEAATRTPSLGEASPASLVKATFYVRSYLGSGNRCVDYGPQTVGSPVFLNGCDPGQPVVVEEINDRHEVILHAGSYVIGVRKTRQPVFEPGWGKRAVALELQNQAAPSDPMAANQVFALDGDSIILVANRKFVVTSQEGRGAILNPLVVAKRELADAEFWDFEPADLAIVDPTSGFKRVATRSDLLAAIDNVHNVARQHNGEAWGNVIKIDGSPSLDLTKFPAQIDESGNYHNLVLPTGVTLRGDRRGTNVGPEIFSSSQLESHLIEIVGDYVRITGLRIKGPTRTTDDFVLHVDGIRVDPTPDSNYTSSTEYKSIIDHNDLSDWSNSTVEVLGGHYETVTCEGVVPDPATQDNVRIERNFMHHNERWGGGYGAVMTNGGRAVVVGNTFLMNRHSIAADGEAHDEYRAWYNLVLTNVPTYYPSHLPGQDFDMHGTGAGGWGGIAGNQVDVAANTLFGNNRPNFELRGAPCVRDYFRNNFAEQDRGDAFDFRYGPVDYFGPPRPLSPVTVPPSGDSFGLTDSRNRFEAPDPTARLGVGNFDADGVEDLFLATGNAWYYSPGGVAEWRFVNAKTDTVGDMLFGDFDRDGRTDVLAKRGRSLMVSWGGASNWEKINEIDAPIRDLAVGNFIGDQRADILWANGQQWFVSDAGRGIFQPAATSSFRVADLRFGDFNGDGKTDVFGVVNGDWMVSYSAASSWTRLRSRLTDTVHDLVVADFDGDGRADVATSSFTIFGWYWQFSHDGIGDWLSHAAETPLSLAAGIGYFSGGAAKDVMLWRDKVFYVVPRGTGTPQRQSRQEMH